MNGPEHYRKAESLVAGARKFAEEHTDAVDKVRATLACAQVHATLALAAATAYPAVVTYTGDERGEESRGWAQVTA